MLGVCGSHYNIPKNIFYLLQGDYTPTQHGSLPRLGVSFEGIYGLHNRCIGALEGYTGFWVLGYIPFGSPHNQD